MWTLGVVSLPHEDKLDVILITINSVNANAFLDTRATPNLIICSIVNVVQYQAPTHDSNGNTPIKTQLDFCLDDTVSYTGKWASSATEWKNLSLVCSHRREMATY